MPKHYHDMAWIYSLPAGEFRTALTAKRVAFAEPAGEAFGDYVLRCEAKNTPKRALTDDDNGNRQSTTAL